MSSWDSIIYFVVKRPYDFILTLILKKVNFLFNINLVQELLLSCLIVFYGRLYLACKLVYKLYHIKGATRSVPSALSGVVKMIA